MYEVLHMICVLIYTCIKEKQESAVGLDNVLAVQHLTFNYCILDVSRELFTQKRNLIMIPYGLHACFSVYHKDIHETLTKTLNTLNHTL